MHEIQIPVFIKFYWDAAISMHLCSSIPVFVLQHQLSSYDRA